MKKYFLSFIVFVACFSAFSQNKRLELDSLMNPNLYAQTVRNLQFVGGTNAYSYIRDNQFFVVNPDGRKEEISLETINKAISSLGIPALKQFPNLKFLTNEEVQFWNAQKLISYHLPSQKASTKVALDEKASNIQLNEKTSGIAYTIENNLFVFKDGQTQNVSKDSTIDVVYGQAVHRNEFNIQKGIFWSPNGNFLAFYRMDESMVADYPLVKTSSRIAATENTKYPMAGMKSHEVTVGVYDLLSQKTIYLKTRKDTSVAEREMYLTNITWSPDEKTIYIAKLNREQNHLWLEAYDAKTGERTSVLLEEESPKYVEPLFGLYFAPKRENQFVYMSQHDGYMHAYLYDLSSKASVQMTEGNWVVKEIVGFNESGENLFFYSNKDNPCENALYSVSLKNGKIERITPDKGTHQVVMNKKGNLFLDSYSNQTTPSICQLINSKQKFITPIFKAENPLKDFQIPTLKLGVIKAADQKTDLYYRMITPPKMEDGKKYPVLLYVYGGPHVQMVTESWLGGTNLYFMYLAQQGYIVFTMDNRGTPYRGFEFESVTHRHLGEIEMADQMSGITYIKSLPYVDSNRIAVDGWSYGGFMSLSLKLNYPNVFKVSTAGGPVIDWKWYEVMYGERYMGTPQNNPKGYAQNSLMNQIKNIKGKIMVIHGAQDPTVVWQNTLEFLTEAIRQGKQLDYFVYPQHEHNVRGKDRLHLYRKLYEYYQQNL